MRVFWDVQLAFLRDLDFDNQYPDGLTWTSAPTTVGWEKFGIWESTKGGRPLEPAGRGAARGEWTAEYYHLHQKILNFQLGKIKPWVSGINTMLQQQYTDCV